MRTITTQIMATANVTTDQLDRAAVRSMGIVRSTTRLMRSCLHMRQVLMHLVVLAEEPANQMQKRCLTAFKRGGTLDVRTRWQRPIGLLYSISILISNPNPAPAFANLHN